MEGALFFVVKFILRILVFWGPNTKKAKGAVASAHERGRPRPPVCPTLYRALLDGRPFFWCWRVLANSATV